MRVRRLSFLLSGLVASACGGSGFTEFQGSAGSAGDTSGGAGSNGAGGINGGGGAAGNLGSSGSSTPMSDAAAPDVGSGTGGSAGSAGAAGAGGAAAVDAGSDAPVCTDTDKDNQTTCAGDCNDNDPTVFKGNTEICGDNKDNNCNASIDENCGGLGTYVSNTGDDKNPGTQAMPVKTIAQGMKNAATIGGKQAVYIGEGHYPEKVTVVEGIDLLGGYQCNAQGCTWQRDSTKYDSAILNQDDEGVLVPSTVTSATTFDGIRIAGHSGDPQAAPGSVALTIDGGTPTVTHNVIAGGNVTNSFRSVGIRVIAPSKNASGVIIDKNQISGGTSSGSSSGIFFDQRTFPASGPAVAVVTNNTIRGGNAPNTNGIQAGSAGGKTVVQGNDITIGTSTSGNGQSWGIDFGGSLTIDANRINVDRNLVGTCAGSNWCGGIVSRSGTATITNNVVFGPGAAPLSAASMLTEAEVPSGSIVLNSNLLDGGGSGAGGSVSAAVVLRIGACNTCGFNGVVGRIPQQHPPRGIHTQPVWPLRRNHRRKDRAPAVSREQRLLLPGRGAQRQPLSLLERRGRRSHRHAGWGQRTRGALDRIFQHLGRSGAQRHLPHRIRRRDASIRQPPPTPRPRTSRVIRAPRVEWATSDPTKPSSARDTPARASQRSTMHGGHLDTMR